MEKFLHKQSDLPVSAFDSKNSFSRRHETVGAAEIQGRFSPAFKHLIVDLKLQSFSQRGAFQQPDLLQRVLPLGASDWRASRICHRSYISDIQFDKKGVYLAAVSNVGTLSIYEYETLYCNAQPDDLQPSIPGRDACLLQILVHREKLESVQWNPFNQDEVACVGSWSNKVYFYDIGIETQTPSRVLKVKREYGHESEKCGLLDLKFSKMDDCKVFSCSQNGVIYTWDKRTGDIPCSVLCASPSVGALNSLQLATDEQILYAATEGGQILSWDLRGGRQSAAFRSPTEVYHPPMGTLKLTSMLEAIPSLRAETEIVNSGIHTISSNPVCGHHLAFSLNSGWSGAVDLLQSCITHLHCPPPPWLNDVSGGFQSKVHRRKPCWLTSHSIFAVGSLLDAEVHFLDFTLGYRSRYAVDKSLTDADQPRIVALSQNPVALSSHPTNDHIVIGTEENCLLLIAEKSNCS